MTQKYISFVFDDGPKEPMLDIVDKISAYGWSAGFAVVGKKINDNTEKYLKYAIEHDFELVSHGRNHIDLTMLKSTNDIADEILKPIEEVKKRLNYKISLARLPFIAYNDSVIKVVTDLQIPLLGQGIDGGEDWVKDKSPESIAIAVLNSVYDGAIACLHVTDNTSKALEIILPILKERGYTLVTPSNLFMLKNIKEIPLGVNISNVI